jgi:hypothetical protein
VRELGGVPGAAALRGELPSRLQDRGQVREESVVIGHPMERGRRQDRVDGFDRDRVEEVVDEVPHPVLPEPLARLVDHRR